MLRAGYPTLLQAQDQQVLHVPHSLRMSDIYRLCDKIDHGALLDVSVFFYNLAVNFGNVVQYNKVNRTMEVR